MSFIFEAPFSYIVLVGALAGALAGIRTKQLSRSVVFWGSVFGSVTAFFLVVLAIIRIVIRDGGMHPILALYLPIVFLETCSLAGGGGALASLAIVFLKGYNFRPRLGVRTLLVLIALVSACLAFFFRPFEQLDYYNDGRVMVRYMLRRNISGKIHFYGTQYIYYPDGALCEEFEVDPALGPENISMGFHYNDRMPKYERGAEGARYYLPDGTHVSQEVFLDNGNFGETGLHSRLLADAPDNLVWSSGAKIWRRRRPSDSAGRVQP